ncbi:MULTISPECIES: thiol:disulfide interchange protein DsbG [unclassified Stenotrophomonas]|uniref:thiol:disulfide interchange protein DsbG n=1 Tax=unclassified Stenotrophomonas TaxID=196198 RepID=UPI00177F8AEA|nr:MULTISPECIES: thiol:disulfide interchange protein DsbG [unclassified Stenotrophomonas]MBD8634660.1 thiol:disulfide interchange protein DsbG [Stenotrophomonas sp. CFBP 13725]MBD8697772.1 thiol:disulfide interchange protein DsbG [Stenotrophomonas sp. CFBP 13718]
MLPTYLRAAPVALVLPILLAVSGCGQAQAPTPAAAGGGKPAAVAKDGAAVPAPIKGLQKLGFEVVSEFDAPGGLRGFAGVVGGQQPAAAYLTPDGKHVVVGSLFDAQGNDVGRDLLTAKVAGPMTTKIWSQLENSAWVADGKADAPRVVYTFGDANCPYCHRFWDAARPWVDAGKVQLRHIMVGVIREDSPGKAAAIIGAKDPSAALLENERGFERGGIKPVAISADVGRKLEANQALMVELGFQGTPGILFKDAEGNVQRRSGMPQGNDLELMFGPR